MKRFFAILLVAFLLVSMCACGQNEEYTEEENEEKLELMLGLTEALYGANAREYEMTMSLLKMTSVVIPDDLPETLLNLQK